MCSWYITVLQKIPNKYSVFGVVTQIVLSIKKAMCLVYEVMNIYVNNGSNLKLVLDETVKDR